MTPQPVYVPPDEKIWWRKKAIGVAAFIVLIVLAFGIGTLIHGFEPSDVKAAQAKTDTTATAAPAHPGPRSNVTLVPVSGSEGMTEIEQPITSAPGATPGQQMNDATALPADQYAGAAARAKAQHDSEEKAKSSMIDPRSLTVNAYQPPPAQRTASAQPGPLPKPMISATNSDQPDKNAPEQPESAPTPMRTSAYLQYKPLPHIAVDHDIQARLDLTVDSEGRVTDVDVSEPVPEMARVIAAVQSWRFKPATENGQPVTSRVSVDITFRANE